MKSTNQHRNNIVFLDIDGPLMLWKPGKKSLWDGKPAFEPSCVDYLNDVLEYADYKIVVISTWRMDFPFPELVAALQRRGVLAEIIGTTNVPKYDPDKLITHVKTRPEEIREWARAHADEIGWFAVVDDVEATTRPFGDSGVHVLPHEGITKKTRDKLVDIFTTPRKLAPSSAV